MDILDIMKSFTKYVKAENRMSIPGGKLVLWQESIMHKGW